MPCENWERRIKAQNSATPSRWRKGWSVPIHRQQLSMVALPTRDFRIGAAGYGGDLYQRVGFGHLAPPSLRAARKIALLEELPRVTNGKKGALQLISTTELVDPKALMTSCNPFGSGVHCPSTMNLYS